MKNTTLCYIERFEKYLMLHRVKKENDLNKDKWIGVGGKLEAGESPEDCVIREVLEETGLTMKTFDYRGFITFVSEEWGTEYMHLFHCLQFSGDLKECDEGNLEWVDKKDIVNLPIWEGDKVFLKLLDEDIPFFSLKLVYKGFGKDEKLADVVLNNQRLSDEDLAELLGKSC